MPRHWHEFNFLCQLQGLTVFPGMFDNGNNPEIAVRIPDNPPLRHPIDIDRNIRPPVRRHELFLNRPV